MLAYEVHLFVHGLDALHVGTGVVGELHLLAPTDMLGAPIVVAHVYCAACLSGDGVETGLPVLDGLACTFGSYG